MRPFPRLLMLLPCLAACSPEPATLPAVGRDDGHVEWRGERRCADCDRIDVHLVLERSGSGRRYRLLETYRTGSAGVRFAEQGRWRHDDGLLWLQGGDGGLRVYALGADGWLRSRDTRGRPLPRDDAALSPRVP